MFRLHSDVHVDGRQIVDIDPLVQLDRRRTAAPDCEDDEGRQYESAH